MIAKRFYFAVFFWLFSANIYAAHYSEYTRSNIINTLLYYDRDGKLVKASTDIVIREHLSDGSNKSAFKGTLTTRSADNQKQKFRMVIKFIKDIYKRRDKDYLEELIIINTSEKYAKSFNAHIKQDMLHFVKARVGQTATGEYCLVEEHLPGFEKYNNNYGYKDERTTWGLIAQAFTHFTSLISKGTLMICDIQGYCGRLTDPAFHTTTPGGIGPGDFGQEGTNKFFQTHTCNIYCQIIHRALKIPLYQTYGIPYGQQH